MLKSLNNAKNWVVNLFRGLIVGIGTGLAIFIFANTIYWAEETTMKYPFLCLLIPVGALITLFVYSHLDDGYKKVTSTAIDEIHLEQDEESKRENLATSQRDMNISPWTGVVGYFMATLSHLLGVATGKEGVGVQIGLAVASFFARIEKWAKAKLLPKETGNNPNAYYLMSGASAAFGALFGSPVSGILFGTQFASPDVTRLDAFLPCTIASYSAVFVSKALKTHILEIPKVETLSFDLRNTLIVIGFGFVTGILSKLFCIALDAYKVHNDKIFKNNRIFKVLAPSGLALIIMIVNWALADNFYYNSLSAPLLYASINSTVPWYGFLVKAALVFLGIAAGFVGGEVVPLLVIGGCFGFSFSKLFGLQSGPMAIFGALGMLSGGTNLPVVSFTLGLELFHYNEPFLLFASVAISYVTSGSNSIYEHQKRYLSK